MQAIDDGIRREVARCVAEEAMLRVTAAAERIAAEHPASGLSLNAVASLSISVGVLAAVPMEIEMPRHRKRRGPHDQS